MKYLSLSKLSSIALSMLLLTFAGCTSFDPIVPRETVNFPNKQKVKLNIKVDIAKSITDAKYDLMDRGHYVYLLGPILTSNVESLSRDIFENVVTSDEKNAGSASKKIDAILVAELEKIDGSMRMWALSDSETTVVLKWTLKNLNGDVLWVDTLKGEAKSITGYGGGSESFVIMCNKRIDEAIKQVFLKSYESIYNSPAVKKLLSTSAAAN